MVPYRTEPPFSFAHGFIRLPPLFRVHRLSPSLHSGPSRLYRMQEGKKLNRKKHIPVIGCRHWIQEEERSLSSLSLSLCIHWMSSKDPPGVLFRGGLDWLSLSRPPALPREREGGREGERERGREGGRAGERERGRAGERERGREGER